VFLWCWLVSTSFAALTLRDSTATAAPLNTGAWTATATSEFTVSVPLAAVTSTHDAEGNVTSRSFADGRVQTLTWDAFNRLVRVTERDSANNGYDWSALYDGLGRRLRTTHQPVVANAASGTPTTIVSLYDPEREFLEIAVIVNGAVAWKVHGPDLNGTYGGWNGTGGLEAVLTPNPESANGGFVTKAIVADAFANVVATVSGMGSLQRAEWLSTRVGAYGPLPNHRAEILQSPLRLAEASAWRTRRVDPTGFYYLGARYYEPHSARFLSPDPLGHGSDMSLYAFANGDPVNRFDPDGRFSKDIWGNPYPVLIPRPAEQTPWDAAVDSGGRYAGAVVETFKVWKWPQAIADFAGTHVASAFYEPAEYFNPFSKTNVDYVKWQFGTADGWGGINGGLLLGSLATVRPANGPTSTQPPTVRVTSWADDGTTPDLNPGRWVQLGEATPVNYFKTGLPGPKVHLEASFPYVKIEGSKASFSNSVSSSVPAASLVWPPRLESWKGILGQRQIKTTE
jgi:RHS repeat-associated protein